MFRKSFNDLFNWELPVFPKLEYSYLCYDYKEEKDKLIIELDLPGINIEDVNITTLNGNLNVEAKRIRTYSNRKEDLSKSFALPDKANCDEISATYEKGVLIITVPYKTLPIPKQIKIKQL